MVKKGFSLDKIVCNITEETLLSRGLEHLSGTFVEFFSLDTFDAGPTSNHTCPSDNRVQHDCMGVDNHIFQNDRVFDTSAISNFNLCTDSDIWSDHGARMDLSWGVDADQAFNLVLVDSSGFRQNLFLHGLVVFHVEFLGSEKLVNMVDSHPKIYVFV